MTRSMKRIKQQIDSKQKGNWGNRTARNQSKAQVISQMTRTNSTTTELLRSGLPHMTEGQIRGVLDRCVKAKRPYVVRWLDKYSPNSMRYRYQLTNRGVMWKAYAFRVGLIEPEPVVDACLFDDGDDDDDDDDEEMAWLGA